MSRKEKDNRPLRFAILTVSNSRTYSDERLAYSVFIDQGGASGRGLCHCKGRRRSDFKAYS